VWCGLHRGHNKLCPYKSGARSRAEEGAGLVDFAGYGYGGLAKDVGDLGFAEAGGVVFEGEVFFGFVEFEAAEAIGVGEFAEAAELIVGERILEFVGDFDECHGGDYTSGCKDFLMSHELVLPS
jgi:hypothetical protein